LVFLFFSRPLLAATDQPWRNSTASTYVTLYVARQKKKPFASLTWATRGAKKKSWRRILYVARGYFHFSLSCVKRLVGKNYFDGKLS
jgi:hypothetical protein